MSIEKAISAEDIGVQFGRYAARGDADDVSLLAFMDALLVAPCDTAADALAVTAWAEGLMVEVMLKLQAVDTNPDLANVAATAVLLCRKAIGALEKRSGLAVEGFGGAVSRPN